MTRRKGPLIQTEYDGCKALWDAVYMQAVEDLTTPEEHESSVYWFTTNDFGEIDVGSFPFVACVLDLNIQRIRQLVKRATKLKTLKENGDTFRYVFPKGF